MVYTYGVVWGSLFYDCLRWFGCSGRACELLVLLHLFLEWFGVVVVAFICVLVTDLV